MAVDIYDESLSLPGGRGPLEIFSMNELDQIFTLTNDNIYSEATLISGQKVCTVFRLVSLIMDDKILMSYIIALL